MWTLNYEPLAERFIVLKEITMVLCRPVYSDSTSSVAKGGIPQLNRIKNHYIAFAKPIYFDVYEWLFESQMLRPKAAKMKLVRKVDKLCGAFRAGIPQNKSHP
ncbi:hypothetical protein T265_06097 [Opisthorchis viverrini]|uniref:Uncharacterized protein n=1 Tax=Opisthorchis viverrini TaxID=6198 RepID=A0A074ZID5_OPIVI|nr:hypothetical protein T265_06097 [Opisthorchis viverrini]KER26736.1 hypothetical protein T265_06097 [Opisthorchis viverrini]